MYEYQYYYKKFERARLRVYLTHCQSYIGDIFNSSKFSLLQSSSQATTNGVSLSNPSKPTMLHYVVLIAALLGGTVSYFGLKNSVFKALNW